MPPTDTRRLPVPDDSRSPHTIPSAIVLVDDKGLRADGRTPGTIRPLFTRVGMIGSARGSAYIEMDRTKVICAVYGPREVTRRDEFNISEGQLMCEFKFATFSGIFHRQHQQDNDEREYSQILCEALQPAVILEKYPRARLDVFVMVLENDGSALSAAITCSALALSNASIEMYDIVVGASLRRVGSITLINPTNAEETSRNEVLKTSHPPSEACNINLTIGYMPSMGQISGLVQDGVCDLSTNQQCIKMCIEACLKIYPLLQKCLLDSIDKKKSSTDKT